MEAPLRIAIDSIDMRKMLGLIEARQLSEVAGYLAGEIERLQKAGADFGLLAANTPRVAFDEIQHRSALPLLSIVEVTCDAARAMGLKRLGLFGTRFTMQGRFILTCSRGRGSHWSYPIRESRRTFMAST